MDTLNEHNSTLDANYSSPITNETLYYYLDDINRFIKKKYTILSQNTTKVNIKIVTEVEMKSYEASFITQAEEHKKALLDLLSKIENNILKDKNLEQHPRKYFLEKIKKNHNILNRVNFKNIHINHWNEIWKTCLIKDEDLQLNKVTTDNITKFNESLQSLQFPPQLLGLYLHSKKLILICIERIRKVEYAHNIPSSLLVQSVLAHEYVHFLHFNFTKKSNITISDFYESSCRSAVNETIAEYIQLMYAKTKNEPKLISWVKRHSSSGCFPGWGYKGAMIIYDYENSFDMTSSIILEVINRTSGYWKNAYYLIYDCMFLLEEKNNY